MAVNRKRILNGIGLLFSIASLVFIVARITRSGVRFPGGIPAIRMVLAFLLPALLQALLLLVLVRNWQLLLAVFSGHTVHLRRLAPVYLKSNIGKYLPGNVMHLVGRGILLDEENIRGTARFWSVAGEGIILAGTVLLINAALFLGGLIPAFSNAVGLIARRALTLWPALLPVAALAGTGLWLYLRSKGKRLLPDLHEPLSRSAGILATNTLTALLLGGMFITTAWMLYPSWITAGRLPLLFAAATVSWLAGFLTPGAPGGIGIREAVCLLLLQPLFPDEQILAVLLAQRIAAMTGDVLLMIAGNLIREQKKTLLGKNG